MEKATYQTQIGWSQDLEKYKETELARLSQDPFIYPKLKKLGFTRGEVKEYLDIFLDYEEDLHYCETCPGIEKCQKKTPCFQIRPTKVGNQIERKLQFCPKMEERKKKQDRFLVMDFSPAWLDKDFMAQEDIDVSKSRIEIVKTLRGILKNQSQSWVYVSGKPRMGKSYLIATFLLEYLKENPTKKAAFLDMPLRLKELNDMSFQDKKIFQETLESYMNIDVLVLDDFGNGYMNEYIRDTVLFPLLNARLKENKLTLITSRFSLKQIQVMFGKTLAEKIKAEQLVNMILSLAKKEIVLEGISVY